MRRYERYKDSGVEWLGEVPSHWEISSLGKILLSVSEKNRPDLPLLSITRELGVIERDTEDQDSNHNFIPDDLSNYKILKKGQFGMNKMKAWQGSYGVSNFTGIVSPAYYIFDFIKSINPQFFHWAIRSKIYVSFFGSASDGVRIGQWDLSKSRMKSIPFIIPSNDEQQKIAQFLDDKTAKIDQAVDLAEKQIALLKEHKQILIQNAVTRGLNPDVPLKDSGVEWIGQVPEHWEVKRSKFIFKKIERKVKDEDQIITCFRDGQVTLRANRRTEGFTNALKEHGYQGIRKGDLVIHAMDAFAGAIGVSDSNGKATPVYSVCLPYNKQKTNVYFYAYYLRNLALSGFISSLAKGIRERSTDFRYADFAELLLPIPPYLEQQKIANYLDAQVTKIDQTIALKTAHIEKLKEYKSVLINDVVTGKVRVSV